MRLGGGSISAAVLVLMVSFAGEASAVGGGHAGPR